MNRQVNTLLSKWSTNFATSWVRSHVNNFLTPKSPTSSLLRNDILLSSDPIVLVSLSHPNIADDSEVVRRGDLSPSRLDSDKSFICMKITHLLHNKTACKSYGHICQQNYRKLSHKHWNYLKTSSKTTHTHKCDLERVDSSTHTATSGVSQASLTGPVLLPTASVSVFMSREVRRDSLPFPIKFSKVKGPAAGWWPSGRGWLRSSEPRDASRSRLAAVDRK